MALPLMAPSMASVNVLVVADARYSPCLLSNQALLCTKSADFFLDIEFRRVYLVQPSKTLHQRA